MSFEDVPRPMRERRAEEGLEVPPPASLADPASLRREKRGRARNKLIAGACLVGVGIIITAVTHDDATRHGGIYIVAFGPIIVGVISSLRGLLDLDR